MARAVSHFHKLRFKINILVLIFSLLFAATVSNISRAYADGGDRKEINASLKGRDVKLLVKISPPILTSDNLQDASIMFRLYDANTNETIKFTSLFLSVIKDGKELLHPDLFQSAIGTLKLKIQPSPGDTTIYANKEPYLDAWEADQGGTINVKGPILLEGGLYRIHIEIFGIDSPREIFQQDEIPKYDVYLSVGDFYRDVIEDNEHSYNVTIVSYYDKVKDFSFNAENRSLAWSMPFNYNLTRVQKESDIFVHEEIRIPWSFIEITNKTFFVGTVDGTKLQPASIAIDPYSFPSELVIHFLINKNQIIQVVRNSPQIDKLGTMKFVLTSTNSANASSVESSSIIFTDTGNMKVSLEWEPSQLSANTPTKLTLKFYDQFTDQQVLGDVTYDLSIFLHGLPERAIVLNKQNNIATNGTDVIRGIIFPENEIYDLEVKVKTISDANSGGAIAPDATRAGKALGFVVVPEFGIVLAIATVISFVGVIAVARFICASRP